MSTYLYNMYVYMYVYDVTMWWAVIGVVYIAWQPNRQDYAPVLPSNDEPMIAQ